MKRETGGIIVFIVTGCLLAIAIGVGVWRSTAPAPTLAISARDSATPAPTGTTGATSPTDPTATTQPSSTTSTATDPREGPVEARPPATGRVTVDRSDPLLPPNAYIPAPVPRGTRSVSPTTSFRPPAEPGPVAVEPVPDRDEPAPGPSTDAAPDPATPETGTPTPTTEVTTPSTTPGAPSTATTTPTAGPDPTGTTEPGPVDPEEEVPPPVIEPPEPPLVPTDEAPGEDAPASPAADAPDVRSGGTGERAEPTPARPAPADGPASS